MKAAQNRFSEDSPVSSGMEIAKSMISGSAFLAALNHGNPWKKVSM